MKPSLSVRLRLGTPRGLTLIELTVVIAFVSVLASLLIVSALRNSRQLKRVQCASNLQQFTLAMTMLANENDDKFPTNNVGFWAWDTVSVVGTFVEGTGCKWTVMYCPGTSPRFTEAMNFQLYNYTVNFRVLGYVNTLPGSSGVHPTNQNATLVPAPVSTAPFAALPAPLPADRVLLADATISDAGQNNEAQRNTYNYTQIVGGFAGSPHFSPHLSGNIPAGGNLGMLDGHVEWRRFADMHPRSPTPSTPTFWW